jgi:hypothetical protein
MIDERDAAKESKIISRLDDLHFSVRRTLEKDGWLFESSVKRLTSIFQNEGLPNHDTP